MTITTVTPPAAKPVVGEDWLAVGIAFATIALVLGGVRPALPAFAWTTAADLSAGVLGPDNLQRSLVTALSLAAFAIAGAWCLRAPVAQFLGGFAVLFGLSWIALAIAGHRAAAAWGLEYVIFALLIGLLVSNAVAVPEWLRQAARSEFYIKIGLVILGTTILFADLMQAGLLGISQALLVVTVVWFVCFAVARRLRVDDEFATMLAAAVSICGVSAAIAACGAIQGDRRKLSYVTSLVLIVAAPMMVVMPHLVRLFGIPDAVGGAWLGGTLDTSAAVVASGELMSAPARNAAVVVKLSQNVLIGVAAFLLTVWWAVRHSGGPAGRRQGPGLRVIWERFPKFVLGFVAASVAVSFLLSPALVNNAKATLNGVRTLWFALAFTSIGLETRFDDLVRIGGGRPAAAFLAGQAFNVVWTLLLAYIFFGGLLFPAPAF